MPHPERAAEDLIGNADGMQILRSLVESLVAA
jgi:phosphoribosylformylglycinamidine (FGAM) synthase-like amidotransferase family enzyme